MERRTRGVFPPGRARRRAPAWAPPAGGGRGRRRRPARWGLGALAALCAAASGGATASSWHHHGGFAPASTELATVVPLAPPGEASPEAAIPGLLMLPPLWSPGDAGAVLLSDGPGPDPLRQRLAAALLAVGAAVLELGARPARRGAARDAAVSPAPPARPADLLDEVFGALRSMRAEAGAGLVVVLGTGQAAGAAALRAAGSAAEEAARLAPGGSGFAAAAAFGPDGAASFAAGGPPPAEERWDLRAPPLCAALAGAVAEAGPTPRGAAEHRLAADCLAALRRPRPDGGAVATAATLRPPP